MVEGSRGESKTETETETDTDTETETETETRRLGFEIIGTTAATAPEILAGFGERSENLKWMMGFLLLERDGGWPQLAVVPLESLSPRSLTPGLKIRGVTWLLSFLISCTLSCLFLVSASALRIASTAFWSFIFRNSSNLDASSSSICSLLRRASSLC